MPAETRFLTIDDILRLHALAIEDQGGDPSLRDRGLLESAVAMPRQQFGGNYLHEGIPAQAAAYCFHICKNHPFIDGNKRAATAAMIVFLSDNGWAFDADAETAEPVILRVAASEMTKEELTNWVRKNSHEKMRMELREFMTAVSWEEFLRAFGAIAPDAPGANQAQVVATLEECILHIPFAHGLVDNLKSAQNSGDVPRHVTASAALKTLSALCRIAEDMGYEW